MIHFQNKAIDNIKRTIIISNTPAFLYNRIKRSGYPVELAKTYTTSDLLSELETIDSEKRRDPFSLAAVYVILIALSMKSDFDLRILEKIDLTWVGWAKEIVNFLDMNSENKTHIRSDAASIKFAGANFSRACSTINKTAISVAPVEKKVKQNEI